MTHIDKPSYNHWNIYHVCLHPRLLLISLNHPAISKVAPHKLSSGVQQITTQLPMHRTRDILTHNTLHYTTAPTTCNERFQ